jgi:hypothetical protein
MIKNNKLGKIIMRIVSIFLVVILLFSCQNNTEVNPYANNLGVPPAVVAQLDTPNYTRIAWQDTVQDFGTIKQGESVTIKYAFTNTGDKPLFISEVQPSCGCTVTDYPRDIIMPGKGGELKATFNSFGVNGFMHKTIQVTTNTSNGIIHVLKLSGQVTDSSGRK